MGSTDDSDDILDRQVREGWGAKIVDRLAQDLKSELPEVKGFSPRNLKYMRRLREAWLDPQIVQQLLHKAPRFHLCTLFDKVKDPIERDWYTRAPRFSTGVAQRARDADRDRRVRAPGQRAHDLREPAAQAAIGSRAGTLAEPYRLDFLCLSSEAFEREIERALVQRVTHFLLELGAGFAFVGRQVLLNVGGEEFFV